MLLCTPETTSVTGGRVGEAPAPEDQRYTPDRRRGIKMSEQKGARARSSSAMRVKCQPGQRSQCALLARVPAKWRGLFYCPDLCAGPT